MLRGLIAGILLTLFVAALTGYAMLRTGAIPANADARPPSLERWAARMSLKATIARGAPRVDDPLSPTGKNLIAGI